MKTFVFLCFICIGPLLAAASFPEGVEVRPNGTFRFGPAEFEIQLFNENWKAWSSSRWTLVKTRSGTDGLDLAAELAAPGAPGSATETLTPLDDNSFRLDSRVTFRNPVEIKALHGLITLPANCGAELLVNGKTRIVPGNIRQSENIAVFTGIGAGDISPDGRFSYEATRCIGACGLAPVMTVNGDVYGRITPSDVEGIIAKYL